MTCLSQFNKKYNFQFDEFDLTSYTRNLVIKKLVFLYFDFFSDHLKMKFVAMYSHFSNKYEDTLY